jgi:hypothetical protein
LDREVELFSLHLIEKRIDRRRLFGCFEVLSNPPVRRDNYHTVDRSRPVSPEIGMPFFPKEDDFRFRVRNPEGLKGW